MGGIGALRAIGDPSNVYALEEALARNYSGGSA